MELRSEITIEAPPERVWHALGERFMHIGEWAAPITSSCPVGPSEPGVGMSRACTITPFGPARAGVVKERLTRFDRERMVFEYEALEGLPSFVARAVNRWSVARLGEGRSVVRIHATLTLRGPMRLFGRLVEWQVRSGGARVTEELKYFVENGTPHPRKVAASKAQR
ncbi:MAG: SRPBCC family protein [Polyangiaceae bacterium]|nr:SRPBCC family protein [Polyangiaceae bacterium]